MIEYPIALEHRGTLHGTLAWPDISPPKGIVVMVAGSGPVNRDGNLPGMTNNSLKLLAHGLAEVGFGSLRTDKRGVGQSREACIDEATLSVTTYVNDTVAWARHVEGPPLVFLGHSEGALITTLAAQIIGPKALVLLAGAGFPLSTTLRKQVAAIPKALDILQRLENGETVTDVPAQLTALFRPSVQGYLREWMSFDPGRELAKLDCPTLVVHGGNDIQVTPDNADHLANSRPGVECVIIEGMNHVLKDAPQDRESNLRAYNDPDRRLSRGVLAALSEFLSRNL